MDSTEVVATEPPTSSLPSVNLTGWDLNDSERTSFFLRSIADVLLEVGRVIDISSLSGVTVAIDYPAALADLDLGDNKRPVETHTNSGGLVGVAKSVVVLRDGVAKTHLVFNAGPIAALSQDDPNIDDVRLAIALIAHECGHVEDHARMELLFPGAILEKSSAQLSALREQFASAFWGEYAACRTSAIFCRSEIDRYRENFSSQSSQAPRATVEAIKEFRVHGDVTLLLIEAGGAISEVLRTASYLVGHIDGLAEIDDDAIDLNDELRTGNAILDEGLSLLVTKLRDLWRTRDEWGDYAHFLSLGDIGLSVIKGFGIGVSATEDGRLHLDVPITEESCPSIFEEIALRIKYADRSPR